MSETTKTTAADRAAEKAALAAKAISRLDVKGFVALAKKDDATVGRRVAIVGKAVQGGAMLAKVQESLTAGLEEAGVIVTSGTVSSIGHYAKASKVAIAAGFTLTSDPTILHAAYSLCTGKVKSADRDLFVAQIAELATDDKAEAFKHGARELVTAARQGKVSAPSDTLPAEIVAGDSEAPEDDSADFGDVSITADAEKLVRQLFAIFAHATEEDAAAISAYAATVGLTAALSGE